MLSNCSIIFAKIMITMKKKKRKGDFNISNFEKKNGKKKFHLFPFVFATSQSKILLQNGYNKMF